MRLDREMCGFSKNFEHHLSPPSSCRARVLVGCEVAWIATELSLYIYHPITLLIVLLIFRLAAAGFFLVALRTSFSQPRFTSCLHFCPWAKPRGETID